MAVKRDSDDNRSSGMPVPAWIGYNIVYNQHLELGIETHRV